MYCLGQDGNGLTQTQPYGLRANFSEVPGRPGLQQQQNDIMLLARKHHLIQLRVINVITATIRMVLIHK
jgi:hypothetical protein